MALRSCDTPPHVAQIDWTFNDGNFGNAQGSGGDAEVTGSTTVQIRLNNAPSDLSTGIELNTDGGNDAYFAAADADFLLGAQGHTYEVRFSGLTEVDSMATFYSHRDPGSAQSYLAIHADGTLNWAGLTSAGTYSELLDGEMHSLAVTWDASTGHISFFVDGEFVEATSAPPQAGSTGGPTFLLGQHVDYATGNFDSAEAFSGTFHDFRVWDHARSELEIGLNHQHKLTFSPSESAEAGLLANWQFDGFNGSTEIVDLVTAGTISENNLSLGHATGAGFVASTPLDELRISEDAPDGTTVGNVAPSDPDITNDVVNDGLFLESPAPGSFQRYSAGQSFGDWTVRSGDVDLIGSSWEESPLGGRSVDLHGSTTGGIYQTVSTEVGRQYQVVFALSGNFSGGHEAVQDFRVSAAGESQDFSITEPPNWSVSNMLWESRSFTFSATDTTTDLDFLSLDAPSSSGAVIADIQVIEIPHSISAILESDSALSFDAATGKFYKTFSAPESFSTAQNNAVGDRLNGVAGQLVTIRSQYENDLIQTLAEGAGSAVFIGATDEGFEGDWRWESGTQDGDLFWRGSAAGTPQAGHYSNWQPGEPSDSGGNDDVAILSDLTGLWDDVAASSTSAAYVVEWDASDVLSSYTFELTDDADGRFAINESTGEITVADASRIDYETGPSHEIEVETTDAAGNKHAETMTITVGNRLEAAQTVPAAQVIDEDTTLTFTHGTATEVSVSDTFSATDARMRVALSVSDGVLTLSQTNGLTFVEGASGSGSMVIEGTEADLNAALDGMVFTPSLNFGGTVTLDMSTSLSTGRDALYTFEGGNANDQAVGSANNGVLTGGATIISDPERGDVLNLDNSGEYVEVTGLFGEPSSLTLAAWVKKTGSGQGEVVSLGDNIAFRIQHDNEIRAFYYTAGGVVFVDTGYIVPSEWTHVAVTFDEANELVSVYADGELVHSETATQPLVYARGANTLIGAHGFGSGSFDFEGWIDDAQIYDRALSAGEISSLTTDRAAANDTVSIAVGSVNDSPTFDSSGTSINTLDGNPTFIEDGSAVVLDGNVQIFDAELSQGDDFGGATLTLARSGGDNAEDVFGGTGSLVLSGGTIELSSSTIGSFSNADGRLVLTFDTGTSNAEVNEVMESITYSNLSNTPPDSVQIDWTFNDGNTGSQGSGGDLEVVGSTIVDITASNDAPISADDADGAATFLTNDPATIGYWRLGEAAGTTAEDETGNHPGTYSNVTLGSAGPYGSNTAADFNGTDSHVHLGNLDVDGTGLTLAGWAHVDDFGAGETRIISKADGIGNSDHTFMLSLAETGGEHRLRMRVAVNGVTSELVASAGNLQTGEWFYAAATYDEATREMTLYLNGVEVGTRTHSQSGDIDQDPTQSVWIGDNPGGGRAFDGRLDEIAVLDRALSLSEIQAIASPTANAYAADEDTLLVVDASSGVLANDTDPEGDSLTAVLVSGPSNAASFSLAADGSFTYTGAANFNGTDTFTYRAFDGTDSSEIATATIHVRSLNDAPVVGDAGLGLPLDFTEQSPAGLAPQFTISDADDTDLEGATIEFVGNYESGADVLAFTDQLGISGTWDAGAGTLTLTGTASVADYQAAIRSIVFNNTSDNPSTAQRSVEISVTDGIAPSNTLTRLIDVNAVNDRATLDLDADDSAASGIDFAASWTESGGPVAVADLDALLDDADSPNLNGLVVTISNQWDGAAEVLAADTAGTSILASYDAATGTLTLSGADTKENYQQVLRTITYDNTHANPYSEARILAFVATDGADPSLVARTTVSMNVTQGVLVVTNLSDTVNGDTSSIEDLISTQGGDGISLREAILAANNSTNGSGPDMIRFDVSGPGPHTIAIASPLPSITETIVIDGSLEPDFAGTPIIVLDGSAAGAADKGLYLAAGSDGSTIRGLAINGFGTGLEISNSHNNVIAGNYFGLGADGVSDEGNTNFGVRLAGGASNNTIGGTSASDRNVVSGTAGEGIQLHGAGTTGNRVLGNYVGTDAAGTGAVGNNIGIRIGSSATGNFVGGSNAGEGNLVSGNSGAAILFDATADAQTVQGNWIGLDSSGSAALGNGGAGISLNSSGNQIGGTISDARNVVSSNGGAGVLVYGDSNSLEGNIVGLGALGNVALGNTGAGVFVSSGAAGTIIGGTAAGAGNVLSDNLDGIYIQDAAGTTIQGNLIGTDITGAFARGNIDRGIQIESGGDNTTIGGVAVSAGNVISANGTDGILLSDGSSPGTGTTGGVIQGNLIGVGLDGTTALGNGTNGIRILAVSGHLIGGTSAGAGNTIAHNGEDGVVLGSATATNNSILANTIHSNAERAIDLENDGTTTNDAAANLDADTGANDRQNFAVLYAAEVFGTQLRITGALDSEANRSYRIEFYNNPLGQEDASGYGEAREFLGAIVVTTDASGHAVIDEMLSGMTLSAGDRVTSTTTRILDAGQIGVDDQLAYGSTSEFSQNLPATNGDPAPTLDLDANRSSGGGAPNFIASFTEDSGAVLIADSDAILFDADSENLTSLIVTLTNPLDGVAESLAANVAGTSISAAYDSGTGILTLSGTDTAEHYQQVLRTVTYNNASQNPDTTLRTVSFVASDGTNDSNSAIAAIVMAGDNDAPVLSNGSMSGIVAEGDGSAPFSASTVADVDSADFAGGTLTLSIGTGSDGTESLYLSALGGVTQSGGNAYVGGVLVGTFAGGSGGAPLVVTFNSDATLARVEAIYQSLAIGNFDQDPAPGLRTLEAVLTDGDGGTSNAATASANFSATNDAAFLDLDADDSAAARNDFAAIWTEDGGPVAVADSDATLVDLDHDDLASLTVTLRNPLDLATESLAADTTGTSIVASYDSGTGVLTLSGTDTVQHYETVLRSITYDNASNTPDLTNRTIEFVASDGTDPSLVATTTLTLRPANDAPTGADGSVTATEDTPFVFSAGDFGFSDTEGDGFSALEISTLPDGLGGVLNLAGSGPVTVGQQISISDLDAGNLSFSTTDANAFGLNFASFTFRVLDDGGTLNGGSNIDATPNTLTIHVSPENDAPVATNLSAPETYFEDTPLNLTDIVVSDVDHGTTTVTLTLSDPGVGVLSTGTSGTTTSTFSAGVWTASGSIADVNDLLAGLTFSPAANQATDFTIATRVDDGVSPAVTGTKVITGTPLNDAPALTNGTAGNGVAEGSSETPFESASVADMDSVDFDGGTLTFSIATGSDGTESLDLSGLGGVSVSGGNAYVGGVLVGSLSGGSAGAPLVVTFNGDATLARVDAIYKSLSIGNFDQDPTPGLRTLEVVLTDGDGGTSNTATGSVNLTAVNDAPVLDLDANDSDAVGVDFAASWTEDGGPVPIADVDATLVDVDHDDLVSVRVTLTNPLDGVAEVLAADTTGTSISASYDSGTGILLLSGSDSVANYQQVLRSVTYDNASQNPETTSRTVSFVADDGTTESGAGTTSIQIIRQNDAPSASDDSASVAEGQSVLIDLADNDSDAENGLDPASITILSSPANGSLTNNGDGTFTYAHDGSETLTDAFTYQIKDSSGASSNTATVTLTIDPENDAATIDLDADDDISAGFGFEATFTSEGGAVSIVDSGDVSLSDPDSNLVALTVTLTNLMDPSEEFLAANTAGTSIVANYDAGTGILTLSGSASADDYQQVLRTVTYNHTNAIPETTTRVIAFVADDGLEFSNLAESRVSIVVAEQNPIAADDSASVLEGGSVLIDVANNDSDYEGALDPASIVITAPPTRGSVAVLGDGTVRYTHDGSETLTDAFTYTIRDLAGELSNPATVSLTIAPDNDAPMAGVDTYSVNEDATLTRSSASGILANDTDAEGDGLSAVLVSGPGAAEFFQLNADGSFSYSPNADFYGTDSFSYRVTDGADASGVSVVTLTVLPQNDAPVLSANSGSTYSSGAPDRLTAAELRVVDVDDVATDLVFTMTRVPSAGHLELSTNPGVWVTSFTQDDIDAGRLEYHLDAAASTSDSFDFDVVDPSGATLGSATFTLELFQLPFDTTLPIDLPDETDDDEEGEEDPSPPTNETPDPGDGGGADGGDPEPPAADPPVAGLPADLPAVLLETRIEIELALPGAPEAAVVAGGGDAFAIPDRSEPDANRPEPRELMLSKMSPLDLEKRVLDAMSLADGEGMDDLSEVVQDVEIWVSKAEQVVMAAGLGLVAALLRTGSLLALTATSVPIWKGLDPVAALLISDDRRERIADEARFIERIEDETDDVGRILDEDE